MNPESRSLIAKAHDSLEAAKLLRSRNYHDFTASRAYYAMFYAAEALLSSLGQSFASHKATIGAFGKEFAKSGRLDPKHHRRLIDAEGWRTEGDYSSGPAIEPEESQQACEWAKEFIEAAEGYLNGLKE